MKLKNLTFPAPVTLTLTIIILLLAALTVTPTGVQAAGITYYVDNTSSLGTCSDSINDGLTPAHPFCTINKGSSVATAGDTVRVLAGTYAEKVVPAHVGTAGNPITFFAAPGVSVTGDLSDPSTNSAFRLITKSYITVDGFTVTGTTQEGIYVLNSNNITISNNHVSSSGLPTDPNQKSGIFFNATTASIINHNTTDHNSLHGIMLTSSSSNITISNNVSYANARQTVREANGILVNNSTSNTIIHNVTYANEDSGIGFYAGSSNNLILGNVSYGNGDHGIDNNNSPNNIIVGNSVQGNVTVGINLEGTTGSGNAMIQNNISVDNGINSPSGLYGNIRVDDLSITGTTLDYNIVYRHSGSSTVITWGTTPYDTVTAFHTATGQETNGLQSDPLWVSPAPPATRPPAVNVGNYHLSAGSPAIDSANSDAPNEPTTDIEGNPRVDDPITPNTGAGTRAFDDRGAFEYQPLTTTCYALTITPGNGGSTPIASPVKSAACTTTGQYNAGELINLTASPDSSHYIASWSGTNNDTSTSTTNTVTMPASAHTVGVIYSPKTTPTLSVTNSPVTYNGSTQAATVTGSVPGIVSNIRYNGSATVPTNAGTYAVTANFVPTDTTHNNNLTGASAGNFIINKATPTLSVTNSPVTYNGSPQTATVAHSVAGTVSNVQYNGSASTPTNAGTYAVTANFTPTDTTNYNTLTGASAGNFVINKATPTLSVTNSPVFDNGSPQAAVVVGSVPGAVSNIRYNGSATEPKDPGTYAVTANFIPTDATNYNSLTGASAGNFVINPAGPALTVAITPSPSTFAKAGDVIHFSYLLTNSGNVPLAGPFTVTDSKVTVTCPATSSLAPAASITCTASYTITLADLNAGSVTNTATASGSYVGVPVNSNSALSTVTTHKIFFPVTIK